MWTLIAEAGIRTAAVNTGDVASMWCEDDLVPKIQPVKQKVEDAVVVGTKSALERCEGHVAKETATSDAIKRFFHRKKLAMLQDGICC